MEELKETYIEIKLGDIAYFQKGFAFKSKDFENVGRKIVKVSNLTDQSIDINSCVCLAEKLAEKYERYSLNLDDIIITTVGSWPTNPASVVGKVIKVPKKAETALLNQNAVRIRANEKITQKYLYYVLKYEKFKNYIINTAQGSASQASITQEDIKNYLIKLPSLETQEKIASILSALDDKIEINNEMNKTLEETAQTLFKRWFIDFDFPNENGEPYRSSGGKMVDSELGEIPEGWEIKEVENIIEVKDGTHDSPKKSEAGYKLVTSKHLEKNKINFESANVISEEDYIKINKRSQVNQYDILISMIGTIGNLYLVMEEKINYVIKNIGLFKTSQNKEYYSYIYFYLKTELIENYIKSRLAGSTQQYISLGELRKIPIIIPNNEILNKFRKISEKQLEKIYFNVQEIQSLTEIRDTLLPKFMSGEIEV